jgi:hypothetical protein
MKLNKSLVLHPKEPRKYTTFICITDRKEWVVPFGYINFIAYILN